MPNSAEQRQPDSSRTSGSNGASEPTGDHAADLGTEPPVASETHVAAGVPTAAPQQSTASDPIDLLVQAVRDLERSDRKTAAAGVSARMRQLDPSFDPQAAGYASFRKLVAAAEARGVIEVLEAESDIAIRSVAPAAAAPATRLDDDLWRAFVQWNLPAQLYFDRVTKQVVSGLTEPERGVAIPSVSREEQTVWMREFVESLGQGEQRDKLHELISGRGDIRAFFTLLRDDRPTSEGWRNFLRRRVLERATTWAHENGIPIGDLDQGVRSTSQSPRTAVAAKDSGSADELLRQSVLTVLGKMPLSELLRLPIPLEYSLIR